MATNARPSKTSTGENSDSLEIATTSVISRIPEFWRDQPRLWFLQFEAVVNAQKQGDDYKFNMVMARLQKEEVQQISDILSSPPEEGKYTSLKNRLISCYEESEKIRLQKLISNMDLGDQKPSQLWRKMKDLASNNVKDNMLKLMWLRQLPPSVTSVLAVTEELSMEKITQISDKIYENINNAEVSSISKQESTVNDSVAKCLASVATKLENMQLSISALTNEQNSNRWRNTQRNVQSSRFRPRSISREHYNRNNNRLCFYHYKYGQQARKCIKPCSWNQGN